MGLTDSGVVGGGAFSLSCCSSIIMGFSTDACPINKSSNVDGEKGGVYACSEHCIQF